MSDSVHARLFKSRLNTLIIKQYLCLFISKYTQLPLILPFGYFAPRRLLILRLWRVGYPLHEPSKCKRFSNFLQIINKKSRIAKKYDRVRSNGNKGKCKTSKLFSFQRAQNKWKLSVLHFPSTVVLCIIFNVVFSYSVYHLRYVYNIYFYCFFMIFYFIYSKLYILFK